MKANRPNLTVFTPQKRAYAESPTKNRKDEYHALTPLLNPAKKTFGLGFQTDIKLQETGSNNNPSLRNGSAIHRSRTYVNSSLDNNRMQQAIQKPDDIELRYQAYQEKLREATLYPEAMEFQHICYQMIKQKKFSKFRNTFLQKLPSSKE